MEPSRSLGPGIVLAALAIVLLPWVVGLSLFGLRNTSGSPIAPAATDTRKQADSHPTYQEVQVDWTFYPDWDFKPVLVGPAQYLVFMFHYTNSGRDPIWLMPSCTFVAPGEPRQAANEEIAMYIEDTIEDRVHAKDQTPISFRIPPGEQRHYIVVFENPPGLERFYVEVDAWQERCLRIHYRSAADASGNPVWMNDRNEWIEEYVGRG
jgi:hypothetical protein